MFSDVPEDLIELGFFQSFPHMYSHKDASSCHSFLHLTVLEYLTVLHASKLSSESIRAIMLILMLTSFFLALKNIFLRLRLHGDDNNENTLGHNLHNTRYRVNSLE